MVLPALLLAVHLDCCQEPPQPSEVQTITAQMQKSAADLKRYKVSHSFGDLGTAAADMDGTLSYGALTRENFIDYRRTLVRRYAYILSELQTFYEPEYDPNERRNFGINYRGPQPQRNSLLVRIAATRERKRSQNGEVHALSTNL